MMAARVNEAQAQDRLTRALYSGAMRRLFALILALGLALAEGWVLPFEGKTGFTDAEALADALGARDPVFAALFLPEPPWRDGWRLTLPRLATPAGARMVAEATGADWVLAGWQDEKGLYHLGLFDGEKSHKGVVGSLEAAALWAGAVLGREAGPVAKRAELEPLLRLAARDPMRAAEAAQAHGDEARARRYRAYAAALAHGKLDILSPALRAFWIGFHDPKKLPEEGMGLVWRAFFERGEGPALEKLIQSPLLLHRTAAVLLLHSADDPRWKPLARELPELEPLYAWGWEMKSFAAFEEGRGEEAKEALLAALRLNPNEGLYWTNLGWAYYLTGNLARARLASEYALKVEENATARYNLGLFYALWGAHLEARKNYQKAVAEDENWEIRMALSDLEDAQDRAPALGYWRGLLLTYAGEAEAARSVLSEFLRAHANHPLAPWARRLLRQNQNPWQRVDVLALSLREEGRPLERFGAGEPLWVYLDYQGEPALPGRPLVLELKDEAGNPAARAELFTEHPPYPPNSVGYRGWAGPLPLPEKPGLYRLAVRWGQAETERTLELGASNLARKLYAKGLLPKDLDGLPVVPEDTLLARTGEERLLSALIALFQEAAERAAEIDVYAKPLKDGKSVAEQMRAASPDLVRAYLEDALKDPKRLEPNAVQGFARWLFERGTR